MSVEDQVFSEKDSGHLSCVDKKICSYKCKDSQGEEKGLDRRWQANKRCDPRHLQLQMVTAGQTVQTGHTAYIARCFKHLQTCQ